MRRLLRRALVLGSALALAAGGVVTTSPAGAATTGWTQFHYDSGHTGWNSLETSLRPGNVAALQQLWQTSVEPGGRSPVVTGGRAFIVEGTTLLATNLSGRPLWTASLGSGENVSELASGAGLVFLGAGQQLRAYDQRTGRLVWTRVIAGQYGSTRGPTVAGDRVFVAAGATQSPGAVYAFDVRSGRPRWRTPLEEDVSSFVAVGGNRVFVATYPGTLLALSARTGAKLWKATGLGEVYGGGPAVKDGIVYLAGNGSGGDGGGVLLTAVRAGDGHRLWQVQAGDDVHSVPAVDGYRVYVGTIDGEVHAFDRRSGRPAWATPDGGSEIWASITSAGGVLYLTRDTGIVEALDAATGASLWQATEGGELTWATMGSVAVVNGRAYVGFGSLGLTVFGLPG